MFHSVDFTMISLSFTTLCFPIHANLSCAISLLPFSNILYFSQRRRLCSQTIIEMLTLRYINLESSLVAQHFGIDSRDQNFHYPKQLSTTRPLASVHESHPSLPW
ncbi:hypothetical protein B0J11DRAFT_86248 [Dendryphion nanum]|uniref:Uncharacterized protein n=1 Tax=Dendryphion nanum TaxID=256645 RepID=A0A9P9IES4_9PLEO|nr:hypothetical protein B0J11DRAFT_86248 [Dendryphion nanum]